MNTDNLYSDNLLINPSADTGSLSPWTGNGQVVDNCFYLQANQAIEQTCNVSTRVIDSIVKFDYLPEDASGKKDAKVKMLLEVDLIYGDGTRDIVTFPCQGRDING